MEADEYQHVKEPQKSDKLTLDNATEEQSKKVHPEEDVENNENDETEADENVNELNKETEEELENKDDLQEISAEKLGKKSDKPCKNEERNEDANVEEHMEVEGEIVETMMVSRSTDTTAHCK